MHGCRRRPRTFYIGRSMRSFAARSAGSVGAQKRAHRDLPATSKRKKSCIKARNCLQTTDISCIVAVETAGCTFCGENFRICHPMNSSRSMLLQASAQEKGKTTRPELCAQDRSEAAKSCLGESQSLRIEPREDRKRARKQRFCFQSASQKNCCQRRILRRKG